MENFKNTNATKNYNEERDSILSYLRSRVVEMGLDPDNNQIELLILKYSNYLINNNSDIIKTFNNIMENNHNVDELIEMKDEIELKINSFYLTRQKIINVIHDIDQKNQQYENSVLNLKTMTNEILDSFDYNIKKVQQEQLKDKKEQFDKLLAGASIYLKEYMKTQLEISETKSEYAKQDTKIETTTNVLNRIIESDYSDDDWKTFSLHIIEITSHSSLPDIDILKKFIKAAEGMTYNELKLKLGFKSIGRLSLINQIINDLSLGHIGSKVRSKNKYKRKSNRDTVKQMQETRTKKSEIRHESLQKFIEENKRK